MNLLKSVMYVKHIIYNMVKLSTFWWCLKAKVSLLKMLLELKFEDKGIFSMQRFTAENLFLTKAMQVYYISRYFLCSLIVSKYKKKTSQRDTKHAAWISGLLTDIFWVSDPPNCPAFCLFF